MIQINLFTKQKQTHKLRERTYGYWSGGEGWGGGRENQGVWDRHVLTAIFKMDNQQGPTVQHRDLCSMLCAVWMGGEFGGEWIHVYVWLSHFAVHLKLP